MTQPEIKYSLKPEQVQVILAGLLELPLKVSGDLFNGIKSEAERQIAEFNKEQQKQAKTASKSRKAADK